MHNAPPAPDSLSLKIDSLSLRPLIQAAVADALEQRQQFDAKLGNKLAFTEAEAAQLLSLNQWQLRDERLRGRIKASLGPGRKILYSRQQLLDYLASRPWN